jgi:hypothetical protein
MTPQIPVAVGFAANSAAARLQLGSLPSFRDAVSSHVACVLDLRVVGIVAQAGASGPRYGLKNQSREERHGGTFDNAELTITE